MQTTLPIRPYLLFFHDKETEDAYTLKTKNRKMLYNFLFLVGRIIGTTFILIGALQGE